MKPDKVDTGKCGQSVMGGWGISTARLGVRCGGGGGGGGYREM